MADYYTLMTSAGLAKDATANSGGAPLQFSELAVGTGGGAAYYDNYNKPELEALAALVDEVWFAAINDMYVHPDNPRWIVVEGIIPADAGAFTVREVGIRDVAGDLVAVGRYPETYKPILAEGASQELLIKFIIEVTNADVVTLQIDPSVVLATRDYVDSKVTADGGELVFSESSDMWARADFESIAFASDFPDTDYQILFEPSTSSNQHLLGDFIIYDKAPNGCKVRATGTGGGTVKWKAVRLQ